MHLAHNRLPVLGHRVNHQRCHLRLVAHALKVHLQVNRRVEFQSEYTKTDDGSERRGRSLRLWYEY
ncbi:hypothetical protein D3C71_2164840 [compost metagenome]